MIFNNKYNNNIFCYYVFRDSVDFLVGILCHRIYNQILIIHNKKKENFHYNWNKIYHIQHYMNNTKQLI